MKILKFGGTSVGSVENIQKIKNILKAQKEPYIVVVSAFSGVTNQLQSLPEAALNNSYSEIIEELKSRHIQVVKSLINADRQTNILVYIQQRILELQDICEAIAIMGEVSDNIKAKLLAQGESLSSQIIYEYLRQELSDIHYLPTYELIKTHGSSLNAQVDLKKTEENCNTFIHKNKNYIAPGFVSSNANQKITVLGRGGSDYTASILGYCVDATQIELWSDVDGMQNANPKIVKNSYTIGEMSYEEAFEMSYFGAKVIYPPAIRPAMQKNIPVLLKNTLLPEDKGTIIHSLSNTSEDKVLGVSTLSNISIITVSGLGLAGTKGSAKRVFGALEKGEINIILISQSCSEQSICIGINSNDTQKAEKALLAEFEKEINLGEINPPEISNNHVILALIGDNMRHQVGLSGKAFSVLGENNINVKAIAQGASERNISIVINEEDEKKAVNVIHEKFFQSSVKKIHLFIIGAGNVGQQFLDMVHNRNSFCIDQYGAELRVAMLANSKKYLFNADGLSKEQQENLNTNGNSYSSLKELSELIVSKNLRNTIVVDNTASKDVSELYETFFKHGISVVTCNKVAGSSPLENYNKLMAIVKNRGCKFQYETTVGAALPIIKTIQNLKLSGDKINRIDAVVSGSLNFIFNNYDGNRSFADIVKQAKEEGYTEPDPRIDLSGLDVIRKILILAREAGYSVEIDDVAFNSFLPTDSENKNTVEEFIQSLEANEDFFKAMLNKANEKNAKLKVVAQLINGELKVSLQEVTSDSPFYNLDGKDNIVALYTNMYPQEPLIIKGAGAGAKVTASGVFSDLLYVVNQR